MIIINLILIRYLIISAVFIGRNPFIQFYFNTYFGKKKARLLLKHLAKYNNKLDKILSLQKYEESKPSSEEIVSKSKILEKYIEIYQKMEGGKSFDV